MRILIKFLTILSVLILASGCASHKIISAAPDGHGLTGSQPFQHTSTSIFGRAGFSSDGTGYVTGAECKLEAITEVEVRRNFGQGVITFLTFGAISPATFLFYCANEVPPPPCDCEAGSEDEF